jgi:hypothetical protein
VTAPAHAEFAAEDALGTLTVTHDPPAVRPPNSFGAPSSQASRTAAASPVASAAPPPARVEPADAPHAGAAAAGTGATTPARVERQAPAAGTPPQASPADPNAEADLATAIRACLAEHPSAENVTVSVSTTLHLALRDDGSVRSARFDPPVAPDVNACAAQWIYKTRFTHGGSAAIGVDFKVPSSAP